MGKYYSAAANADALADSNGFALANVDSFAIACWFAGGIAFSDVCVSDLEPDAGQVNTERSLLGGCPAWIRTMNKASKGRCVTVTPQGKRVGDFLIAGLSCQR